MQELFGGQMKRGPKVSEETRQAIKLYQEQSYPLSIAEAAKLAGIAPSTLYRALFPNGKTREKKTLALREKVC